MKKYAFIILFGIIFLLSFSSVSASEMDPNGLDLPESEDGVSSSIEVEDEIEVPEVDLPDQNQGVQQIDISVLSDDLAAINDSLISSMEFSLVRDYVKGLLLNMSNMTEYVFFTQVVDGFRHYYLYYDLDLNENGDLLIKDYPYYDIYNVDGIYYQSTGVGSFNGYPSFAYGSFGSLSALVDKQFHFNDFYLVIIGLMIMFIMFRKRVFT